jgi:hypothetical protein
MDVARPPQCHTMASDTPLLLVRQSLSCTDDFWPGIGFALHVRTMDTRLRDARSHSHVTGAVDVVLDMINARNQPLVQQAPMST